MAGATLESRATSGGVLMLIVVYTLTIFLSAFLLFFVQPMVAKMLLPLLGGSPSVWNTAMVFFQGALLAGYAYAHGLSRLERPGRAVAVHAAVVLAPLALLPVRLREGWARDMEASPIPWLLAVLLLSVGLPFFAVSATGPLLQRWFSRTDHPSAGDPYFLYAASNAGSMLALLAYPFAVEPFWTLGAQRAGWSWGYAGFAALMIACGVLMLRRGAAEGRGEGATKGRDPAAGDRRTALPDPAARSAWVAWVTRLRWVALAAVPSSYMLGVTQYLSTDIAAVPLLWVVPLAIYLLTFIIAFSRAGPGVVPSMSKLLPVAVVAIVIVFALSARNPIDILIALHLIGLFLAAMLCHGRLAAERPAPVRLTEYFLLISLGGVLGGIFNAVVAPLVFTTVIEYPIAIVAATMLRLPPGAAGGARGVAARAWAFLFGGLGRRGDAAMDLAWPLLLIAVTIVLGSGMRWVEEAAPEFAAGADFYISVLAIAVPVGLAMVAVARPVRFGLSIGAALMLAMLGADGPWIEHKERTFFGVYNVGVTRGLAPGVDGGPPVVHVLRRLSHGTTVHGNQNLDPRLAAEPLSYYHRGSPIGQLIMTVGDEERMDRIGILGLGVGSLAAYGREGQEIVFFEIDPAVVRIAYNPEWFTFLRDSGAERITIRMGDGRLTIGDEPDGSFGLLILDAFSSDAIPTHLLTREAIEMYLRKVRPDGLIAFHISNRYLDLVPVVGAVARDLGLVAIGQDDGFDSRTPEGQRLNAEGKLQSHWMIVGRRLEDFGRLDERWMHLEMGPEFRAWTDDYTNIMRVLR